ncbi:MAG: aminomethyltransferase family protein, partial [Alphaproteobacteria bacterium]
RVRDECLAVRDNAGVINICGFTRLSLCGPGAADWLDGLIAGRLPMVGKIGLAYFPDRRGRIVTEMSVIRSAENEFLLITAAVAQWHDRDWLLRHRPGGAAFTIEDVTAGQDCLLVTGPESRDILTAISDADLALPWLSRQDATVAGHPAMVLRVSFAGELGWEVHCATDHAPAIWDAVTAAGAKPFGMFALDSLRLEKGYRAWKGDLSTDYSLLEGGLDRFVKFDKPCDFLGKAALQSEMQRGVAKRFVTLILENGDYDAPYMSTLWFGDEVVGETTSGGWGFCVNASVALGMLRADLAVSGTQIEVEIYGERYRATVQEDRPLWDPANQRLRG